MNRRSFLSAAAVLLTAGTAVGLSPHRADAAIFEGRTPGVAVNGHDVVAYFDQSRPVPGDPAISHHWNGTTWRFSTAANRDAFAADPERYAPQFDGWCAYGVAQGAKVKTEPHAWSIHDGKLYLNYDQPVQDRFVADPQRYIREALKNWPDLR